LPIGGAALAVALAIGVTLGFLTWRAGEQRRVLDLRGHKCAEGDVASCDDLRSACVKRSGDACVTLAEVHLAGGPRWDGAEGLRLLGDACTFRHAGACLRAGRAYLEGRIVTKDVARARPLLARGCELGAREACALGETLP
jgi:TPR repeat protein